jgi:hypothetical protein
MIGGMRKGKAGRVLLVSMFALCALMIAASPAGALTVHRSGSYPGTATTPQTWLFDGNDPFDYAYYVQSNARTVNQNYTYRNAWQWVCVQHRLWEFTPSHYDSNTGILYPDTWTVASRTAWQCKWISPSANSVRFPLRQFKVDLLPVLKYAQDTVITWARQNGTRLGKKVYDYNASSDYSIRDGLWLSSGTAQNGDVYFVGVGA